MNICRTIRGGSFSWGRDTTRLRRRRSRLLARWLCGILTGKDTRPPVGPIQMGRSFYTGEDLM